MTEKNKVNFLSAKEAFKQTIERGQKAKEEQKELVLSKVLEVIQDAINNEEYVCSFSFVDLKPFTATIVEFLKEKEYRVITSANGVKVSWLQKDVMLPPTEKAVLAKVDLKKASNLDTDNYERLMSEDDNGFENKENTPF